MPRGRDRSGQRLDAFRLARERGIVEGRVDAHRLPRVADALASGQATLAWRIEGTADEAGRPALAIGIIRTGAISRLLGWVLLVLGVGVGLVAYPLQYFRFAGSSLVVLAAMLVFFVWLTATGIALLRWRPTVVTTP